MRTGQSLRARTAVFLAALLAVTGVGAGLSIPTTAQADGPTTFTNATTIVAASNPENGPGQTTPYPSGIQVSGMNGAVSGVSITLNSLNHLFVGDLDVLLVAPTGQSLVVMSDIGASSAYVSAEGASVTLSDAGTVFPSIGMLASGTYAPSNQDGTPDVFPAPAPTPGSATTFAGAFSGIHPNGEWRLFVVDSLSGDDGTIGGGWSLTVTTTSAQAPSAISADALVNPAFIDEQSSMRATVTADGAPVTAGTVTFTVRGTTSAAQTLDANGRAEWTPPGAGLPEGTHTVTATYSGSASLLPSSTTFSYEVNNRTVVTGQLYCNPGTLPLLDGPAQAYPQRIFVDDISGTIADVRVRLNQLSHTFASDLDIMLVSPAGDSLVLLSDVPGSANPLDLVLSDDGAPLTALGTSGTFAATNLDGATDFFPTPAPTPSAGTTFAEAFAGTPVQGTWSLFVVDNSTGDTGSLGSWCLELVASVPTGIDLAAPATVATGTDVEVTATVTTDEDEPVTAGTVAYTVDGGTPVAAGTPDAAGQVTFTIPEIARGTHTVAATYTGTDGYEDSTAAPVTVAAQSATTLTLTAPTQLQLGTNLSVTATVGAADGPVTAGTVSYSVDGGSAVAAGTPDATGTVTFGVTGLARGSHTVAVSYTGADGWTSVAAETAVMVQSGTTLALSAPSQIQLGDDLSVTASVAAADGPVTAGTVTYSVDGGTPVAAGNPNADGTLTFTVPGLIRGTHTIDATYTGADGWTTSTATQVTVLAESGTSIALSAPASVPTGEDFEITATVTAADGPVTAGTVTYSVDGGTPVAVGTPSAGVITFTVPGLTRGTHSITVTYTGADGWTSSTSSTTTVAQSVTGLALTAPATIALGDAVSVTAAVTAPDGPVNAGTVSYSVDGGTPVSVGTPDADGEAVFTIPGLTRGNHTIAVAYTGTGGWNNATADTTVLVQSGTSIVLSASPQIQLGDDLSVTATLTADDGPVTAGTVSYSIDGGTSVVAGNPNADGTVTFDVTDLARGTHTIDATYTGADAWTSSTATQVSVLVESGTSIALDAPASVPTGEDFEITATVTAEDGPVTAGTLSYSIDGGTPVVVGSPDADGEAVLTIPGLTRGSHTITVSYTGTGGWTNSVATQTAVLAESATALALAAPSDINLGEGLATTVTLTAADGPVTAGTISYVVDDGAPVTAGAPGSDGTLTFTIPGLTSGAHSIVASYAGADAWTNSAAAAHEVLVDGSTTLVLTAPASASDGDTLTLTAKVSAPAATPSGSVAFSEGGTVLATLDLVDGVAELSTTLPVGVRAVIATYVPTGGFAPSTDEAGIDVLPVATAGGPYAIAEGEGITLSAAGSTDAATIGWDLDGDGDFSDATGAEPTLTWVELEAFGIDDGPATYEIAARAEIDGLTVVATGTIEVSNTGPDAVVDGPRTAVAGESLTFTVNADDPSSADMAARFTYLVNWGDGSPAVELTGPSVTHTYAMAGTYEATFTVVDRDGDAGTAQVVTIEVAPAPVEPTEPPTPSPTPPAPTEPAPTAPTTPGTPTPPSVRPGLPASGVDAVDAGAVLAALALVAGAVLLVRRQRVGA